MASVLVADDERGICDAFADFLSSEGHEALIASNGNDAVQLVRDRQPAVAFLDVQMPGGDGLSALESIRAIAPDLPLTIRPYDDVVAENQMQWSIGSVFLGIFGGGALLLASLGIYGLISFSVSQRERELVAQRFIVLLL